MKILFTLRRLRNQESEARRKFKRLNPDSWLLTSFPELGFQVHLISILFGAYGMNLSLSTACASGAHAIGQALRTMKMGYSDIVITGGTEAAITPLNIYGYHTLKALSTSNNKPKTASRPFIRSETVL